MKTLRLALPLLLCILFGSVASAHPFALRVPLPAPTATYYYVVTGVDANGLESANSSEAKATLVQGMTKGVTLTWVNPSPAAGSNQSAIVSNNVYRGTIQGGPYTKINTAPVTGGTTYLDPFVAPPVPTGTTAAVN